MDVAAAVAAARRGAAFFDLSGEYALITIGGADHADFLHALTSNEVTRLPVGGVNRQALLTKKSTIVADFILCRTEDRLLLLVRREHASALHETLEQYHFAEEIAFAVSQPAVFALGSPDPAALAERWSLPTPFAADRFTSMEIDGLAVTAIAGNPTGEPGWLLLTDTNDGHKLGETLRAVGAMESGRDVFETMRIEAGELVMGADFDESNLLLELGLGERIVSADKGCYPGQEVVARVQNRGRIARRMMGIVALDGSPFVSKAEFGFEQKNAGRVGSACHSPTLSAEIAIALLRHDLAVDGHECDLRFSDSERRVRVVNLPFHRSPAYTRAAESCYTAGMAAYHADDYGRARSQFGAALAIEPRYADAWEALAMTAEKQGRIDEAIVLNRRYADLDPDAIMAHTNLSRLYMLQGFKERAEEEQGKATLIEFRLKAKRRGTTAVAADDAAHRAAEAAERERKMGIFRQVLEMDPQDEIANFGLGKLFLETGDYPRAIGHLRSVIEHNADYSAAWELLCRALAKNGDFEEAIGHLRQGIDIATRRGDLMPAGAMKELLKGLGAD